jgi:hypothetical protein
VEVRVRPINVRTLANSNYKEVHSCCHPNPQIPEFLQSIYGAIMVYCDKYSINRAKGSLFFNQLYADMNDTHEQVLEMTVNIRVAAQRLWTSSRLLDCEAKVEICSIVNEIIRNDIPQQLEVVMPLVYSINSKLVNRDHPELTVFPPEGVTYRGVTIPKEQLNFFISILHQKYRAPMYLATSFSELKAYTFMAYNKYEGREYVIFRFYYDARGAQNPLYRCLNVSLITNRAPGVGDELEYLFVPYSVFYVRNVEVVGNNTVQTPHIVHLDVMQDNLKESEELPLAPWC